MAVERVRWRNVREFLDDLPEIHCTAKPPHEFCTICMRINYIIANDCPLYHVKPKRKLVPVLKGEAEPIKEHVTSEDVRRALTGEEYPIIEFAKERGGKVSSEPEDDEEIYEVEPIEVEPVSETKRAPSKEKKAPAEEPVVGGKAPEPATTVPDANELLDRIMQEIEVPSRDEAKKIAKEIEKEAAIEAEEDSPKAETESPKVEEEGPAPEAEKGVEKEPSEEKKGKKKAKPRKSMTTKGSPPVVEKRPVTVRKKKDK